MKLKVDAELVYQHDAINAVVDLFDGQPLQQGQFELSTDLQIIGLTQTAVGLANAFPRIV